MIKIICLLSFASFLHAFLLDTNTPRTSGGLMTDNHYDYLLKFFMDERNARLQLQQYVVKQQGEITALSGLKARLEKLENTTSMNTQTNTISDLHDKYLRLEEKYNLMQSTQIKLSNELQASRNQTLQLEREVTDLKQVKAINQLQALSKEQQQLQSLQQEVNSLKSNSQARGQDLVAMYNDVTDNKKKLSTLEVQQQFQLLNISSLKNKQTIITTRTKSLENNQSAIVKDLSSLGKRHDAFFVNISQELQSKYQTLESEIQKTKQTLATDNEYVSLTATGTTNGHTESNGYVPRFPKIITSFGISNLSTFKSTGTFTCQKKGLYLVSVTLLVCTTSGQGEFKLYKNSNAIVIYDTEYSVDKARKCHSGGGTVTVDLHVNDTIKIKTAKDNMELYEQFSSLSIVKLK